MFVATITKGKTFVFTTLFIASACVMVQGSDWPQFRGPNHDGSSPEKILKTWQTRGPRQIWKAPLTDGFSAMTVGGGKVFTLVAREMDGARQEACVGLDAATGKELWATAVGIAKYDGGGDRGAPGNDGGDGPRSTPAYDDGKVFTYSSRMVLKCLDAESGKEVWSENVMREHNGKNITWESASSPLIEGDLVYVACGGAGESLLAFDKKNGKVVWKGESDALTHSTPIAATILGVRQVIFFTKSGLVAMAPKTGAVLWRYEFKFGRGSAAISPVVSGDIVYCSAAYNIGSRACKITKTGDAFTATRLWTMPKNDQANHWTTPVCADGYLYGIFDQAKFGTAPLKCVDIATGEAKWSKAGFGPGGCTLVDGHVLVLSDAGDLVLVKATPEAYTEVTRSHVLAGECWKYASNSNGRGYGRSTKEGGCLRGMPQMTER